MSEILAKNVIVREPGYFYYFDKEGNACRAKMSNNTGKKYKKK